MRNVFAIVILLVATGNVNAGSALISGNEAYELLPHRQSLFERLR
jgi:hypothetical protein